MGKDMGTPDSPSAGSSLEQQLQEPPGPLLVPSRPIHAALPEATGRLRSGLEPDQQPKGKILGDFSGAMVTPRKPG